MRFDPIFVAGPTRCGTTMITGLIHFHGAWVGEAKVTKHHETNSIFGSENIHIKELLKTLNHSDSKRLLEQFMDLVETDGHWVVKTAQLLMNWQILNTTFPYARWVFPHRPIGDIVASALRHPGMNGTPERRKEIAEGHLRLQQEALRHVKNSFVLDADKLARGDFGLARELIEFCGLQYSYEITKDWIKPEMWHGS